MSGGAGNTGGRGEKAEQGTYIACSDISNKYFFWKMWEFSSRIRKLNKGQSVRRYGICRVILVDQAEKRLIRLWWGNSPKRISQSVNRVNGRPTLTKRDRTQGIVIWYSTAVPEEAKEIDVVQHDRVLEVLRGHT